MIALSCNAGKTRCSSAHLCAGTCRKRSQESHMTPVTQRLQHTSPWEMKRAPIATASPLSLRRDSFARRPYKCIMGL